MRYCSLVAVAFLIAGSSSALSQSPGNRVAEFAQTDARLMAPVTVEEDEIYVGDLLERVSAQTGVEMRSGRDGSADVRITVFARAMPLDRLMQSLFALLSHQDAEVYWERDGKPGQYSYTLRFPQNARTLAARLREEAGAALDKVVETMLRLADMSPEERKRHRSEISRAHLQEDDNLARRLTDDSKSRAVWAGLKLFKGVLTTQQRSDALSNGKTVLLKADQLTPAGRELLSNLHSEWRAVGAAIPDIMASPASLADETIAFRADRSSDDLIGSLTIGLSPIGGHQYAGGVPVDRAYQKKVRALWVKADDVLTVPASFTIDKDAAALTDAPDHLAMFADFPTPLQQRLRQFAAAAHVPVLARISSVYSQDPGPVGASVTDFVKRVAEQLTGLNVKWSGTSLLIEEPRWFLTAESMPSWSSMKWFRKLLADRQGVLRLADMCELTRQLSKEELANSGLMKRSFGAVPSYWDFFRLLADKPTYQRLLLSEGGLPLTADVAKSLETCPMLADSVKPPGVRALTLTIKPYKMRGAPDAAEPDRTLYNFGWMLENGQRRAVGGFLLRKMGGTAPQK